MDRTTMGKNKEGIYLPDPQSHGSEYEKTATIFALQIPEEFTVQTKEGPISCPANSWFAKGPHDDYWCIQDDIFRSTYRPLSPKKEGLLKTAIKVLTFALHRHKWIPDPSGVPFGVKCRICDKEENWYP